MENKKKIITVELQGEYLEGMEDFSRRNFRQLREQIMAILHKELHTKGAIDVENM